MLVTIDFETYYDKDYTLKKLSTSEYVRHELFEVISCAIKIDSKPVKCYFGKDDIAKALSKLKSNKCTVLAHHTQFDGLILTHHFGFVPARWACTMSMARAVVPKHIGASIEAVGPYFGLENKLEVPDFKGKHLEDLTTDERKAIKAYNIRDVDICYGVYQELIRKNAYPDSELDLIDVTVRMFTEPVLELDIPLATKELEAEQERKREAIAACGVSIDTLASNPKFAAALEALGVTVPQKQGKNGPIPAIAKSDEEFQALLSHPDKRVVTLVEARLAIKSTIGESRAARLLESRKKGLIPVYLNYCGAHTQRWSGGDKLNFQNFKQSKKSSLRQALRAPDGWQLVVVDAAQIEARVVAWLAGEQWVLDAFRNKRDLYCEFASKAYNRTITKADPQERFVGKTCVLGLGFGMAAAKLQHSLLTQSVNQGMDPVYLDLNICSALVSTYRKSCLYIVRLWETLNNYGLAALDSKETDPPRTYEYKCLKFTKGEVHGPNGLPLLYPEVSCSYRKVSKDINKFVKDPGPRGDDEFVVTDASYQAAYHRTHIYGGLLTENLVQWLARIIVADVMRKLAKLYRIVMMSHDELVFLARTEEAQAALDLAIKLMSTPPSWAPDLPLNAEGGFDVCYSK